MEVVMEKYVEFKSTTIENLTAEMQTLQEEIGVKLQLASL